MKSILEKERCTSYGFSIVLKVFGMLSLLKHVVLYVSSGSKLSSGKGPCNTHKKAFRSLLPKDKEQQQQHSQEYE